MVLTNATARSISSARLIAPHRWGREVIGIASDEFCARDRLATHQRVEPSLGVLGPLVVGDPAVDAATATSGCNHRRRRSSVASVKCRSPLVRSPSPSLKLR